MSSEAPRRRGLMLVISSPSGAGKTSLSRRLVAEHPDLTVSVSATTRAPRPGEQEGREYHFVTPQAFADLVERDAFLEWAQVHDNRYGSPSAITMTALAAGLDVLFDIDWQGARAIAGKAPEDTVRIFILPPTMAALAERLHTRAQDSETVIASRLAGARTEIEKWGEYDYVIVNEDFETAYRALAAIYLAECNRRTRNPWLTDFVGTLLPQDAPETAAS